MILIFLVSTTEIWLILKFYFLEDSRWGEVVDALSSSLKTLYTFKQENIERKDEMGEDMDDNDIEFTLNQFSDPVVSITEILEKLLKLFGDKMMSSIQYQFLPQIYQHTDKAVNTSEEYQVFGWMLWDQISYLSNQFIQDNYTKIWEWFLKWTAEYQPEKNKGLAQTVFFGFGKIAEKLDPVSYADFAEEIFTRITLVLEKYNSKYDKFGSFMDNVVASLFRICLFQKDLIIVKNSHLIEALNKLPLRYDTDEAKDINQLFIAKAAWNDYNLFGENNENAKEVYETLHR